MRVTSSACGGALDGPGGWRPADAAAWFSRASLVAVAVGVLAARATGTLPSVATRGWMYLALMVGVSLPHGGFEHVANLRGRGERLQARYLLAYLGLVAASLALFVLAPAAGLLAAVTITMLKGGHGGLQVLRTRVDPDHLRSRWQRALAVAVRGGAVMVVPFVVHPGIFSVVGVRMVGLFGPTSTAWLGAAFAGPVRAALGAGYALLVAVHLVVGAVRARRTGPSAEGEGTVAVAGLDRAYLADAGETLLLAGYFAVVPPILAVGVYFPCWYATRQVARMTASGDAPERLREVDPAGAVRRFLRGAAAPWTGAVALFAAVARFTPPADVVGWVALYSVVVAVIAVPHVLVGSWLDRRQGIWSVGA